VKIKVTWVGRTKDPAIQALTDEYVKRITRHAEVEAIALKDEAAVLKFMARVPATRVLLDAAGKQMSSEEFAAFIRNHQDRTPTPLIFAIGAASGFSAEAKRSASLTLSLGKMTLPHELARVLLLEQIYRAFTILTGHPYHLGH
jgi:23S rRNA (pseudouridine1915-N3)-methyltransferase